VLAGLRRAGVPEANAGGRAIRGVLPTEHPLFPERDRQQWGPEPPLGKHARFARFRKLHSSARISGWRNHRRYGDIWMCNKILLSDFWCVRAKASDMYEIEMQEMSEAFLPCWKAAAIHLDMQAHKYVFYICPSHPITYASQLRNDGTIKVISLRW
jgi:hypothetical protein